MRALTTDVITQNVINQNTANQIGKTLASTYANSNLPTSSVSNSTNGLSTGLSTSLVPSSVTSSLPTTTTASEIAAASAAIAAIATNQGVVTGRYSSYDNVGSPISNDSIFQMPPGATYTPNNFYPACPAWNARGDTYSDLGLKHDTDRKIADINGIPNQNVYRTFLQQKGMQMKLLEQVQFENCKPKVCPFKYTRSVRTTPQLNNLETTLWDRYMASGEGPRCGI